MDQVAFWRMRFSLHLCKVQCVLFNFWKSFVIGEIKDFNLSEQVLDALRWATSCDCSSKSHSNNRSKFKFYYNDQFTGWIFNVHYLYSVNSYFDQLQPNYGMVSYLGFFLKWKNFVLRTKNPQWNVLCKTLSCFANIHSLWNIKITLFAKANNFDITNWSLCFSVSEKNIYTLRITKTSFTFMRFTKANWFEIFFPKNQLLKFCEIFVK